MALEPPPTHATVAAGCEHTVSRIVAGFAPGTPVTTPRHQIDVVVTEFGAAELAGCTMEERAAALAEIAHPDFRDSLRAEVAKLR